MTFAEVRNAIQSRLLNNPPTGVSVANIHLDNQQKDPPTGSPWVDLWINHVGGFQSSLGREGNRIFEKRGLANARVFTPLGTATDVNDGIMEEIKNLYEGVRIGRLWFVDARGQSIGPDDAWYQQNLLVEFRYTSVR